MIILRFKLQIAGWSSAVHSKSSRFLLPSNFLIKCVPSRVDKSWQISFNKSRNQIWPIHANREISESQAEHEAHANYGKTCTRRLKWRESHKTLLGSWYCVTISEEQKSNKHGGIFNIKRTGVLTISFMGLEKRFSTCTSMRTFPPFQAFHQLHSESSHGIISFQGIKPKTI